MFEYIFAMACSYGATYLFLDQQRDQKPVIIESVQSLPQEKKYDLTTTESDGKCLVLLSTKDVNRLVLALKKGNKKKKRHYRFYLSALLVTVLVYKIISAMHWYSSWMEYVYGYIPSCTVEWYKNLYGFNDLFAYNPFDFFGNSASGDIQKKYEDLVLVLSQKMDELHQETMDSYRNSTECIKELNADFTVEQKEEYRIFKEEFLRSVAELKTELISEQQAVKASMLEEFALRSREDEDRQQEQQVSFLSQLNAAEEQRIQVQTSRLLHELHTSTEGMGNKILNQVGASGKEIFDLLQQHVMQTNQEYAVLQQSLKEHRILVEEFVKKRDEDVQAAASSQALLSESIGQQYAKINAMQKNLQEQSIKLEKRVAEQREVLRSLVSAQVGEGASSQAGSVQDSLWEKSETALSYVNATLGVCSQMLRVGVPSKKSRKMIGEKLLMFSQAE